MPDVKLEYSGTMQRNLGLSPWARQQLSEMSGSLHRIAGVKARGAPGLRWQDFRLFED